MEQITLIKAVLALFRQNLTREQIADELKIETKKLDEEMDLFFDNPESNQKKRPEKSFLPFDFDEKLGFLNTPILEIIDKHKKEIKSTKLKRLIKEVFKSQYVYVHMCLESTDMFESSRKIRNTGKETIDYFKEILKINGIDIEYPIIFTVEQQKKLLGLIKAICKSDSFFYFFIIHQFL